MNSYYSLPTSYSPPPDQLQYDIETLIRSIETGHASSPITVCPDPHVINANCTDHMFDVIDRVLNRHLRSWEPDIQTTHFSAEAGPLLRDRRLQRLPPIDRPATFSMTLNHSRCRTACKKGGACREDRREKQGSLIMKTQSSELIRIHGCHTEVANWRGKCPAREDDAVNLQRIPVKESRS